MEDMGEGDCLRCESKETGRAVWSIPSVQCQEKGLEVGCGGMDGSEES